MHQEGERKGRGGGRKLVAVLTAAMAMTQTGGVNSDLNPLGETLAAATARHAQTSRTAETARLAKAVRAKTQVAKQQAIAPQRGPASVVTRTPSTLKTSGIAATPAQLKVELNALQKDQAAQKRLATNVVLAASANPSYRNALMSQPEFANGSASLKAVTNDRSSDEQLRRDGRKLGSDRSEHLRRVPRKNFGDIENIQNQKDLDITMAAIKEERRLVTGETKQLAKASTAAVGLADLEATSIKTVERKTEVVARDVLAEENAARLVRIKAETAALAKEQAEAQQEGLEIDRAPASKVADEASEVLETTFALGALAAAPILAPQIAAAAAAQTLGLSLGLSLTPPTFP